MYDKLISWSKENYSHLPWRKNRSIYRTLVSEIMLQQTTVSTVLNKFEEFFKTFPDLKSLAKASDQEMLIAWKGLGYYRRAKNLKNAACNIVETHKSQVPEIKEQLKNISGIGEYTASALIAIGMDKEELAVDANLERVISRLYALDEMKGPKLQKLIKDKFYEREIFKKFKGSFRDLNEALMDLGRTICQARKASCEICPLNKSCEALKNYKPLDFPKQSIKTNKILDKNVIHLYRLIIIKNKKILAYKKEKGEWLEGQIEIPTLIFKADDKNLKQYPWIKKKLKSSLSFKTSITKYQIINWIVETNKLPAEFKNKTFWADIESKDFSTSTFKALKKRDQE